MNIFPFQDDDREKGETLLPSIRDLFFSEGTYQVLVFDGEEYWPFLHLEDDGSVRDAFCTCEKEQSCPHLAAAYLYVTKNGPLHVRFRTSLWKELFHLVWQREGAGFSCETASPEAEKKVRELTTERAVETEENSLKFSNLPPEELKAWRVGRPSQALRYELSEWADLAKYAFFLEEQEGECQIDFLPESRASVPETLVARFAGATFTFAIEKGDWETIIPAFAERKSPIPMHEFTLLNVRAMRYDEGVLHIDACEETPEGAIDLGTYCYSPKNGFFPKRVDPLLLKKKVEGKELEQLFTRYPRYIARYLEGETLHFGKKPLSSALYFDGDANFHIESYLFEKGDLQGVPLYGDWVYLAGKGFYEIEEPAFHDLHKVVLREEMSEFISLHRLWLAKHDGFQTHLASLDAHLTFTVDQRGLFFEACSDFFEDASGLLSLGDWIYIKGRGFYARGTGRTNIALRPGLHIPVAEISDFIDQAKDDLEAISGFFSSNQPLIGAGLNVAMTERGTILVHPFYEYQTPYSAKTVRIFKHYTYVDSEGFSPIPTDFRLPDAYARPVEIDKRGESAFLHYELPAIQPYIYKIDARLRAPEHLRLKVRKIREAGQGRWLIEFVYESEFGTVPVNALWEGIQQRKIYITSPAGLIYFNQSRFNWLKSVPKESFIEGKDEIELTTLEWIRLQILEEIKPPTDDPESIAHLDNINALESADLLSIKGLQSSLRPYQDKGLRWLWFLYCHGLSGLLCDEMGLGKTHQAMALLAATLNQSPPPKKKFLIVCPTSVIYHWENLLQRFLPKVKVRLFYGLGRSLTGFARSRELLLTSYGTLRSEQEALSKFEYEVVIFDEIQVAKNAFSQTHKALRGLRAHMKLGLTGTPIENRLFELKSLFDIILPGYFPSDALYKELFVTPIEKRGDDEKKTLLTNLIKPFVLRRKKDEVLEDLPEKIEEISICELSPEQKRRYKEAFQEQRDTLLSAITDEGQPIPYVHIFSLFNTLKQICDHPALALKNPADYKKHESGKWELFVELLHEARESGQKVVVFSQYLGMLDIIKHHLREHKIGFAEIRGSTKNRKEQMEKFKNDPSCEVFIGSLQAAGVGIDLVTASVVIHYDRWWNPAKENQATDRVHRIGQSRGVQVFKLVTKETIEEHIHALIEKKLGLLENIVGFDDQDQIKSLERSELAEILSLIQADLG